MLRLGLAAALVLCGAAAHAAELSDAIPPLKSADVFGAQNAGQLAPYLRALVGLTLLSFIPAALMAMTSFTRTLITLSFIRHAIGLPETPPTAVLVTLSIFMTMFVMGPTLEKAQAQAFTPFMDGRMNLQQAAKAGVEPFKQFMSAHVREQDVALVSEMARKPLPAKAQEADLQVLVPAFMLSELRVAFSVGFVIFLPFLLVDLIVSAVLMSLGMMMMPPATVSLPLKLLLFVLIDGWGLVVRAIAGSYQ
ncbi:MAG: flagellar biosynthesis protein FliP [Aquabacterium sp.]|nr:MAG: flagellar biosynthesis protein FliP [Aquabacterium sp.]